MEEERRMPKYGMSFGYVDELTRLIMESNMASVDGNERYWFETLAAIYRMVSGWIPVKEEAIMEELFWKAEKSCKAEWVGAYSSTEKGMVKQHGNARHSLHLLDMALKKIMTKRGLFVPQKGSMADALGR